MMTVGYAYSLFGEVEIDEKDFENYCRASKIEPNDRLKIDSNSLKRYLNEKFDLIENATEEKLSIVD